MRSVLLAIVAVFGLVASVDAHGVQLSGVCNHGQVQQVQVLRQNVGYVQQFNGGYQQQQGVVYVQQQQQQQQQQPIVIVQQQRQRRRGSGLLFGGGNAANVTDSLGNTFVNLALIRALSR